jgi:hypothetical protein
MTLVRNRRKAARQTVEQITGARHQKAIFSAHRN